RYARTCRPVGLRRAAVVPGGGCGKGLGRRPLTRRTSCDDLSPAGRGEKQAPGLSPLPGGERVAGETKSSTPGEGVSPHTTPGYRTPLPRPVGLDCADRRVTISCVRFEGW